jgi:hypothetical protein
MMIMNKTKILTTLSGIVFAAGLCAAIWQPAAAFSAPPGFYSVKSVQGAELFQKDYSGGNPDYVLVVSLAQQAGVSLLTGSGDAVTGELLVQPQSLTTFWESYQNQNSAAFCVINGAVFTPGDGPTRLPLGLKRDGQVLNPGLGASAAPGEYLQLELWSDHASINAMSDLNSSDAPNILGGQALSAVSDGEFPMPRTFAGIADSDGDGQAETLILLTSATTAISEASQVLADFGAQQSMALGSGSQAQLICQGQTYNGANDDLVQAIGIAASQVSDYSASASQFSEFPVVVAGENTSLEVTVKNTGTQAWQAGEVSLINQRDPLGTATSLTILQNVAPGESAQVSWQTQNFEQSGIYTTQWDISRGGASISDHPVTISVVVIPQELEARKAELETQVRGWVAQKMDNIQGLVLDWIEAQVRKGFDSLLENICPSAALLPGLLFALAWFLRRH